MNYLIMNMGCDDTTKTEIELTDDEFKAIRKFAIENNKNVGCQCQPEIAIFSTYTKFTDGSYDVNWCDDLIKDTEEEKW